MNCFCVCVWVKQKLNKGYVVFWHQSFQHHAGASSSMTGRLMIYKPSRHEQDWHIVLPDINPASLKFMLKTSPASNIPQIGSICESFTPTMHLSLSFPQPGPSSSSAVSTWFLSRGGSLSFGPVLSMLYDASKCKRKENWPTPSKRMLTLMTDDRHHFLSFSPRCATPGWGLRVQCSSHPADSRLIVSVCPSHKRTLAQMSNRTLDSKCEGCP